MTMISDPNLIYYACIARGTTILAEFNSKDADLGALALKCLDNTPPFHSIFTHTVRNRTYTFLIEDPFSYFGIFDQKLENSEGLAFLRSVKEAFNKIGGSGSNFGINRLESLSSRAFQGEFSPVFRQLLSLNEEIVEGLLSHTSSSIMLSDERNGSSDSGGSAGRPLLGDAVKCWKKKRFLLGECGGWLGEKDQDDIIMKRSNACDDGDGVIRLSREYSVDLHNNALYSAELGRQKSKKIWKRHVWIVLSLDLIICTILFVVWLSICRGFKCIDS